MSSHLLHRQSYEKLADTLAQKHGKTIKYTTDDKPPHTFGSTIYVHNPSAEMTEEQYKLWLGILFHEIGHDAPQTRDIFPVAKERKINTKSLYGFMLNILDDYRQERLNSGQYEGMDQIISFLNGHYTKKNIDQMRRADFAPEKGQCTAMAFKALDLHARQDWQPGVLGLDEVWLECLPEEAIEQYDKIKHLKDELNTLDTAEQEIEFLDRLFQELDKDPEEDGGKTRPEGELGDLSEGELEQLKKMLVHDHGAEPGEELYPSEFVPKDTGEPFRPSPVSEHTIHDCTKEPPNRDLLRVYEKITSLEGSISKKVKKLLYSKTESRWKGGQKKGRLHKRNLYRVPMSTQNPDLGERIRKQRQDQLDLDVAVTVLVDMSGSMSGPKYVQAAKMGMMLCDGIQNVGVPVEILGFTYVTDKGPAQFIYKTHQQKTSPDRIARWFAANTTHMDENSDGESILWAHSRLIKQPNKRKMLLVISDGQPCAPAVYGGSEVKYTKNVVKQIQDKSPVELYGIGVQHHSISNLYKNSTVIDDPAMLESEVFKIIKNRVFL